MAFATCAAMASASSAPASWRLHPAMATSTLMTPPPPSSSSSVSPSSCLLTSSSPSPRSAVLLGERPAPPSPVLPPLRLPISLTSSRSPSSPPCSSLSSSSRRSSSLLPRCTVSGRSHHHALASRRWVGTVSPSSSSLGYGRSSDGDRLRAAALSSCFFVGSRVLLPGHVAGAQRGQRTRCGGALEVQAMKDKVEQALATGIRVGKQSWDAAVAMVPESVPRPVARSGVGVVGVLIAWTILKTLISTVLSLVVVAGVGFVIFRYLVGGDGSGGQGGGGMGGGSGSMNDDEALAEAKRIMDKYK
ncbi:hypothetical protein CBR_g11056 [Chara braunii]|uniref:Uncharacterized protein n=1 Tax=Chara braunii TaxID=69332 RepID=A0A388KQB5_CHABU|nr:hypothetical protein CBR_g11056 [Chara braunii]|eukprot:GBG72123.1 hypothetical protein CBR_g11056 [Chara braunii]